MEERSELKEIDNSNLTTSSGLRNDNSIDPGDRAREPVPDGGWGWVVVCATLIFNIIYDGCSYSFGILYTDLLDYFGDTKSNTAWIGSLFFSVPLICAPLASFFTKVIGSRKATMLGGLIASIGFFIGAFSTSVLMLVIFYGLVGGFGMSLPYFNSLKTVTDYFDKRLALASGIAECGAGLGTVIFAPFTKYLVSTYGWRGTLIILSGIVGNIIVCGALYRPLKREKHLGIAETGQTKEAIRKYCSCCFHSDIDIHLNPEVCEEQGMTTHTALMSENTDHIRPLHNWSIHLTKLKSIPFIIFAFSNFVMYFWYDVPYVFTFDRSVGIGIEAKQASYLLSIIGFVHLFGILGYGVIGDFDCTNLQLLYGISTAFCGLVVALVPLLFTFVQLAVVSGGFGLFSAASEALLSCVLIDIVGKDAFDSFYCGLILFMEGVANLIGPPIAGFLFDSTGTYDMTFYTAGGCVLFAGCMYVVLSCSTNKKTVMFKSRKLM